jgi:general secretion pathway protein M
MKRLVLNPRQGRALALGVLVGAMLLVIALLAVPPYLLHRRYDAVLSDYQIRLQRFQKMAAQHPEYARALEAIKAKNGRRFYLKASAVNLAGAEVQEMVRAAVEGNGGRLGSIQIGQAREDGTHRLIPVSVQMVANVQSLQRILNALEGQTPFVFVDNMTLRTGVFRGFRPTPGVEPEINVQLDVSAYLAGSAN